jgi:uncharacterized membrane protein
MTATSIPSPWPRGASSLPGSGARNHAVWLFGREVADPQDAAAPRALQWLLRRNCSITPRQLGGVYLSLCGVSALIAAFFFWQGAPYVMAFAGMELLLVGIALLAFARHVGDREVLTLAGRSLSVEQVNGSRIARNAFTAEWLTVEPVGDRGSLVQLSGEGRTVRVGRFLRPELRAAFARELRLALRRAPTEPKTPEPC